MVHLETLPVRENIGLKIENTSTHTIPISEILFTNLKKTALNPGFIQKKQYFKSMFFDSLLKGKKSNVLSVIEIF